MSQMKEETGQKAGGHIPHTRIRYVPPTDAMLDEVARKLCEKLAQRQPAFADAEVRHGFSSYLKVVASMATKRLNNQQAASANEVLDSDAE